MYMYYIICNVYNINIKVNSDDSSSEDNLEIKQIHLKKKR